MGSPISGMLHVPDNHQRAEEIARCCQFVTQCVHKGESSEGAHVKSMEEVNIHLPKQRRRAY